jgi:hypothetical protein
MVLPCRLPLRGAEENKYKKGFQFTKNNGGKMLILRDVV